MQSCLDIFNLLCWNYGDNYVCNLEAFAIIERLTYDAWVKNVSKIPDIKLHGANKGPTWVLSAPDEPHVGPINFVLWDGCLMVWTTYWRGARFQLLRKGVTCVCPHLPRPCWKYMKHYNGVIMGTIASQITSLTIVYSAVYSGANQRKHQRSASLAFVRGIHRWPVNSPTNGK